MTIGTTDVSNAIAEAWSVGGAYYPALTMGKYLFDGALLTFVKNIILAEWFI